MAERQSPARHKCFIERVPATATLLASLFLAGCVDNAANMLNATGPAAAQINLLWWFMFAVGGLVYLIVMGYMLIALFRRRNSEGGEAGQPREGSSIVVWGGAIIPAIILAVTFGATVFTMGALNQPEGADDLVIEVTGNQWWWEVRYPQLGFRTANEIHIPVGQPVAVKLTSEDVIHSFWVPKLHGKLDMLPGEVTEFWWMPAVKSYNGSSSEKRWRRCPQIA